MLLDLSVENVAIIDRAALELGPGLTVVTGETGAGKSLLVDAIALALGGRADSDLVRSGTARASVGMTIESAPVADLCQAAGVSPDEGRLVVQRDVSAEGRSTVRLNGRPVAVGVLRALGSRLVDLHGQHDHQALLAPEAQIEFLDEWIGVEAKTLRDQVAVAFTRAEDVRRRLSALRTSVRDREQRADMLRFQTEEIRAVSPKTGDRETLEAEVSRLVHAERLHQVVGTCLEELVDADGSASEALGSAVHSLAGAVELDPALAAALQEFRSALANLDEGARSLSAYAASLEAEPGALEAAAGRLDALKSLFRKYGEDEAAVLAYLHEAESDLAALSSADQDAGEVEARLADAERDLKTLAGALTDLRTAKASEFEATVVREARELAMESAVFQVRIEPKAVETDGADSVSFDFSANPGEAPRPLAKTASGGETSRLMLAIKVASAGRAGVPTLVFDEVDTGLSGRAAAVTAKKLKELSRQRQVIVITHLPQIAGQADVHVRIDKAESQGRTVTSLTILDAQERLAEVARLLAGEEVGESALANARELIVASV